MLSRRLEELGLSPVAVLRDAGFLTRCAKVSAEGAFSVSYRLENSDIQCSGYNFTEAFVGCKRKKLLTGLGFQPLRGSNRSSVYRMRGADYQ